MVKRKVDGCETTIKRGSGCILIKTKLRLTDNEIKNGEKLYMKLNSYTKTKGEILVSKIIGNEFDNNKLTEKYVAIETIVRINDYNLRLSIVNNQQRHMRKVKEVLKQM